MNTIMGLPERFWAKATVRDTGYETPCLVWTAGKDRDGYARFQLEGKARSAHCVAFEGIAGPVPEGLQLDHLCRVPACVNWTHLEPVTHRENVLRSHGPIAVNAAKTHCANGHPFNEANTYRPKAGARVCRTCNRQAALAYKRRKKESAR